MVLCALLSVMQVKVFDVFVVDELQNVAARVMVRSGCGLKGGIMHVCGAYCAS